MPMQINNERDNYRTLIQELQAGHMLADVSSTCGSRPMSTNLFKYTSLLENGRILAEEQSTQ